MSPCQIFKKYLQILRKQHDMWLKAAWNQFICIIWGENATFEISQSLQTRNFNLSEAATRGVL